MLRTLTGTRRPVRSPLLVPNIQRFSHTRPAFFSTKRFENPQPNTEPVYTTSLEQLNDSRKNVVAYTHLMQSLYRNQKKPEEALAVYEKLKQANIQPNERTYNVLVGCYIDSGKADSAFLLLDEIKEIFKPPFLSVYNRMLEVLRNQKNYEKVFFFFLLFLLCSFFFLFPFFSFFCYFLFSLYFFLFFCSSFLFLIFIPSFHFLFIFIHFSFQIRP